MIPMPISYDSLAEFYADDERRRGSAEIDVGLRWRGANATYRAAWVRDTREIYLFEHLRPEGGGGAVHVLGHRYDEAALAQAFAGWRDVCGEPGSLTWLLARSAYTTPLAA